MPFIRKEVLILSYPWDATSIAKKGSNKRGLNFLYAYSPYFNFKHNLLCAYISQATKL